MANVYDQNWPISFVEQKSMANLMLEKAKTLLARKAAITIRQIERPSRQQWEAEYVAQTKLALPIPIGTKLVWYDLRKGECQTFVTTKDSDSGVESTGEVFQFLNTTWPQPSLRLLGVCDFSNGYPTVRTTTAPSRLRIIPGNTGRNFVSLNFNENQAQDWAKIGLDSFFIMYQIAGNNTSLPLTLFFRLVASNDFDPFMETLPTPGVFALESATVEITSAATNLAAGGNTSGAPITANNSTSANFLYPSSGFVFLNGFAQKTRVTGSVNQINDSELAPSGLNMGSYQTGAPATTTLSLEMGAVTKIDEYSRQSNMPELGLNTTTSYLGARVWVYGLFKQLTESLPNDYI